MAEGVFVTGKGVAAAEEVVHDDPEAPNVDFAVVGGAGPYFRGHIDRRPAVGVKHFFREYFADSEISQFEYAFGGVGCK